MAKEAPDMPVEKEVPKTLPLEVFLEGRQKMAVISIDNGIPVHRGRCYEGRWNDAKKKYDHQGPHTYVLSANQPVLVTCETDMKYWYRVAEKNPKDFRITAVYIDKDGRLKVKG